MEIGCETSERVFSMKTFVSDYEKDLINQKKSLFPWESIQKWCQTLHVDNVSLSVANQALSVDKTLKVVVTQKVTLQPFRVYLQDRFQNFW